MTSLNLHNISKSYGAHSVLQDIDLNITKGEFVVFVGPSGCGKSTLLRMIAGLEEITQGQMTLDGQELNDVPPAQRGIAMVFQSYALYPHMTVRENMGFGLKISGLPKREIAEKVQRAAESLQLTALLDRLPKDLSGGQRQRVAIGRAICRDPKVFLFDEPLSNLDAALRVATRLEIARLKQAMPQTTMIYVTHDQIEAMTLADRIVVLAGGRIAQVGTPMDLYHRPADTFVAQFIGAPGMNLLPLRIDGGKGVLANGHSVPLSAWEPLPDGTVAQLGVRPEHLRAAPAKTYLFEGRIAITEELGEFSQLYVDTDFTDAPIIVKVTGQIEAMGQGTQRFSADPSALHLFDATGKAVARRAN